MKRILRGKVSNIHAYFELIRYNLLDNTVQPLLKLYPNAVFNSKLWKPEAYAIPMSKRRLAKLDHYYHHFDEKTDTASVTVAGKGNPGFDIGRTKEVMLTIEIRWSDEGSTDISLADILKKRALIPAESILIVLAYRELGHGVVPEDLPPNTMVLGWEQLRKLYGPSLAARPQFWVKRYCLQRFQKGEQAGELCLAEVTCENCQMCMRHCTADCKKARRPVVS